MYSVLDEEDHEAVLYYDFSVTKQNIRIFGKEGGNRDIHIFKTTFSLLVCSYFRKKLYEIKLLKLLKKLFVDYYIAFFAYPWLGGGVSIGILSMYYHDSATYMWAYTGVLICVTFGHTS